ALRVKNCAPGEGLVRNHMSILRDCPVERAVFFLSTIRAGLSLILTCIFEIGAARPHAPHSTQRTMGSKQTSVLSNICSPRRRASAANKHRMRSGRMLRPLRRERSARDERSADKCEARQHLLGGAPGSCMAVLGWGAVAGGRPLTNRW